MSRDYERVEAAIRYLNGHFKDQPELAQVASHVGLSDFHFQRLFRRWAGISPKRFLQFLTAEYAGSLLRESRSVLDATYSAGLSGPARLHDLIINVHAVTPGELKTRGAGVLIRYGIQPTPFGQALIALTDRGICSLAFFDDSADHAMAELEAHWPAGELLEDQARTAAVIKQIFARTPTGNLTLDLAGTNFQIRVWDALLRVPPGSAVCYEDIAARIGQPKASRAVGAAVGRNPIAYLIPCHRVLRKTGEFGGYHWGPERKKALLAWEGSRLEAIAEAAG